MNISTYDSVNVKKITVLGMLNALKDQSELIQVLSADCHKNIEISFYEARALPELIVQKLASLLDSSTYQIKIIVYHGFLASYLCRLGISYLFVQSKLQRAISQPFKAIALGGSADSLDKALYLIERLPLGKVSVFIVQHVAEHKVNLLDRLLKQRTDYSVIMPHHLEPVRLETIYIAPPGYNMRVSNGLVYLTQDRKINYARPSIEALFQSLAWEYGQSLIAVLLCGYGHDGVEILKIMKDKGSSVIIQKSEECKARVLTDSAIEKGAYDDVLSVSEIGALLSGAVDVTNESPTERQIDNFLEALYTQYGYDFRRYQKTTVQRRLKKLMNEMNCHNFFDFQRAALTTAEVFERLFLELSINVTSFFRHPDQFLYLRKKIFPYLNSFSSIKIWCAGCASGEEAYSLAITLYELGMLDKTQLFATDINPYIIEEAKNGLFSFEAVKNSIDNYNKSGGSRQLDNYFIKSNRFVSISPLIKEKILFYTHSLSHDGVFNEFQLILCRNVMIYFQDELKERVKYLLASSLHRDGYLVLGKDEVFSAESEDVFEKDEPKLKIYRIKNE
jgi:chemotaxis protein methyltransferase CheR